MLKIKTPQPITAYKINPNTNTALINTKAPLPVLADDAHIYNFKTQKLLHLPNIQQNINTDTAVAGRFFITINGGMQPEEVRFIEQCGAWNAVFPHPAQILLITQADNNEKKTFDTAITLDASGLALIWNNNNIIDHTRFILSTELVDKIKFTPPVAISIHKNREIRIKAPDNTLYSCTPQNAPKIIAPNINPPPY